MGRIPLEGQWRTVPELAFEKKELIPAVQKLLISFWESRLFSRLREFYLSLGLYLPECYN